MIADFSKLIKVLFRFVVRALNIQTDSNKTQYGLKTQKTIIQIIFKFGCNSVTCFRLNVNRIIQPADRFELFRLFRKDVSVEIFN